MMEYNAMQTLQRRQWASSVNTSHDNVDHGPAQGQAAMNPNFNRQISEPTFGPDGALNHMQGWSHTSAPGPQRPNMQQRPVTIHEGAFSTDFAKEFAQANSTSWTDFTNQGQEQFNYHASSLDPNMGMPTYGNMNHGNEPFPDVAVTSNDGSSGIVPTKPNEDHLDFSNLDTEFATFGHDMASTDDNASIINLRKMANGLDEPLNLDTSFSRRYSGSSFVSSTGGPNDIPDISAYSEVPSYASDYTPRSSVNLSATPLSPVPSPRYPSHSHEIIRAGSRSRASPSPRPSMRVAPYTIDGGRNKRWSTGCFGSSPARRSSPFVYNGNEMQFTSHATALSRIDSPGTSSPANGYLPSNNLSNMALHNSSLQTPPRFHRPTPVLGSNFDGSNPPTNFYNGVTPVLPSNHNQIFRTLTSNCDPYLHHHLDQYACLSDPPDLFGSLSEEQNAPPPEDMNPSDPELIPHEQELRFDNDLYTPRWVRGHGNKREGWCGICKPGRWLVLKNSAFWYDKSFTHGVSAATGQAFEGPRETRRMEGNADVWEGLCGSCGDWIALVSSKKKGTTWFRHAYKCHTHQKIKDVPKRRRENSHLQAATSITTTSTAASTTASATPKAKTEPVTPDMSSASLMNSSNPGSVDKTFSPLHSITSII